MYLDHYGLSAAPFQLTPDARFWFESRTHKKAMAYLGYGLAQGEGFITITGEIGAGKSTLVAHLMAKIDRARLNAIHLVSTQVEGDDVLRLVAQGLGLDTDGTAKALLLDRVEQALDQELRAGKRSLVIVDEAQNLPVSALEELRMLSNFQLGGRALVQIVLLGQPEFRDKLTAPGLEQLRQRVIATHHLDAMGADEVEPYVRHRLSLVDWAGRPDFSSDAFEALHRHSGGIPRRLNQLLTRLLLHGALEEQDRFEASAVNLVAADMSADRGPADDSAKVLPLRSASRAPAAPPQNSSAEAPPAAEPAIAAPRPSDVTALARISALEARLDEQEATLRRTLSLLIDWAEQDGPRAPWNGVERRIHAV